MENKGSRIFIFIFAALLAVPLNPLLFQWDRTKSVNENRNLAEVPSIPKTMNDWNALPGKLEAYIKDRMAFRDTLLQLNHFLSFALFRQLDSKSVLAGKDGWYFFREDRNLDSYRNIEPMTSDQLQSWIGYFIELQTLAKSVGAKMYVLFPPNSTTIYGEEFLPPWIHKVGPEARLDQILSALNSAGIQAFDFRAHFMEKKKEFPLYQKTDTHWNAYGAYFAYEQIFTFVQKDFPSLVPVPFTEFDFKEVSGLAGDLGIMLGLRETLVETQNPSVSSKNKTDLIFVQHDARNFTKLGPADIRYLQVRCKTCGGLKAFIYHDSFFTYLEPYFYPHFLETNLQNKFFSRGEFAKAKPDVFFVEIVERRLMQNSPPKIEP